MCDENTHLIFTLLQMPRGGIKPSGRRCISRNTNSANNKGGAASVGNTNSSSREKKISNLFEEGCAFDRHSDDMNALSKFRKVIELEHPTLSQSRRIAPLKQGRIQQSHQHFFQLSSDKFRDQCLL